MLMRLMVKTAQPKLMVTMKGIFKTFVTYAVFLLIHMLQADLNKYNVNYHFHKPQQVALRPTVWVLQSQTSRQYSRIFFHVQLHFTPRQRAVAHRCASLGLARGTQNFYSRTDKNGCCHIITQRLTI